MQLRLKQTDTFCKELSFPQSQQEATVCAHPAGLEKCLCCSQIGLMGLFAASCECLSSERTEHTWSLLHTLTGIQQKETVRTNEQMVTDRGS